MAKNRKDQSQVTEQELAAEIAAEAAKALELKESAVAAETLDSLDTETSEQVREAAETSETPKAETTACRICGKRLTDPKSTLRGIGPVCIKRMAVYTGRTEEQIFDLAKTASEEEWIAATTEAREKFQKALGDLTEAPEGYISSAAFRKAAVDAGVPLWRAKRAYGGNRGLFEPMHEDFAPVYVGRIRYVPGKALSHLDELKAENWQELFGRKTSRGRKAKEQAA